MPQPFVGMYWWVAHRPADRPRAPVHQAQRPFACDGCGREIVRGEYATVRRNPTRRLCDGCDPFHLAVWQTEGTEVLANRRDGCPSCDREAARMRACTRCHGSGVEPAERAVDDDGDDDSTWIFAD